LWRREHHTCNTTPISCGDPSGPEPTMTTHMLFEGECAKLRGRLRLWRALIRVNGAVAMRGA